MVTRRTAKSKGSKLEYDVQYSLKRLYPDIYLTKERGFQRRFDICSDEHKIAIECKRHKTSSWSELLHYISLLEMYSPPDYKRYVIFKPNRQPALVFMYDAAVGDYVMRTFANVFGRTLQDHPSTRPPAQPVAESTDAV